MMGNNLWLLVWLIISLWVGTLGIPELNSWRKHRKLCTSDEECDSVVTHMHCFKREHACDCKGVDWYDASMDQCRIKPGGECEFGQGQKKCVHGAYCRREVDESGAPFPFGTCTCETGFQEDNMGVCSKIHVPDVPQARTSIMTLLESKCLSHADCEIGRSPTFLKCLKVPSQSVKICVCRDVEEFDADAGACRIGIGGGCDVITEDGTPEVQKCVKNSICRPDPDVTEQETARGTCCSAGGGGNCEIIPEIPSVNNDLWGKPCEKSLGSEQCNSAHTFLKCLRQNRTNVCVCGNNNEYDKTRRKCFLGPGNGCFLAKYEARDPQQCVPHTVCKANEDSRGKSVREGTCTCRDSSCARSGGSSSNVVTATFSSGMTSGLSGQNKLSFLSLPLFYVVLGVPVFFKYR